jgi:HD-like signal output (HDOD) protein
MTTEHLDDALPDELLPMLPAAARKALELVGTTSSNPRELSVLLEQDESMAARLLQAVNTGRFNLVRPCTSLTTAIEHLGFGTVRLLVIGFSLVNLARDIGDDLDLSEFWRRCFYAAAAARRLSVISGTGNPEVAFIAGLLQDIGMLAMLSALGEKYRNVLIEANGDHTDLPRLEQAAIGFTHAEAGARLGAHWGLNANLVAPIRLHHQSVTALGADSPEINVVALASRMSANEDIKSVMAMSKTLFNLTAEQTRTLMQQTARDTTGLSGMLDVKEMAQPQSVPVDLRQKFEEALSQQFNIASGGGGVLGLIIGEVDAMDALLTRFGATAAHQTLDAICKRVRPRCGYDPLPLPDGRFAVLLPGATRYETAMLAERIRQDVAGAPFDIRDRDGLAESLLVSISAGAAALEPATARRLNRPEKLSKVAENALDAAVRAGRDCVRVFIPRTQGPDGRSHAA